MVDIVMPLINTSQGNHTTAYFARLYDLKAGSIKDRLQACKPTVFLGVPLVWEKIADRVRAVGAANTGIKAAIGAWAKDKAIRNARSSQHGEAPDVPFGYGIASSILSKVA